MHWGFGTAIMTMLAGCATESQSNDAPDDFGIARNALVSRVEAETQSWTPSTGDSTSISSTTLRLNANATGDSFTFSTTVTTGTYSISVRFAQRNIYGNFQVYVNGTSVGSLAGYSSNTSDTWTTLTLGTLALSGNVEFKFVSTGKASAATDFDAKLDYIELTSSTSGAGGASSTGGTTAKGGTTSTGGTTAKGGTTSTGGTTAKGGTTSTGGTTAKGGTTSTGGTTAQGGNTSGTVVANAIYVAPTGTSSAAGTITAPTTLATAISRVSAGQTIYLRGGTYALSSTINLTKSGTSGSQIALRAYPLDSTRPVLDFSAMSESGSNRGISLSGSYWYVYGVDVFNAGDNCMFVSGSNNVIEFSTFSECSDTGLQLSGGASNNLIRNCDSYYNADSALENADGFASKLDVGSGNKFVGCRAWNNLDDGWDGYLRGADNITTTYENCWAIDNGKLKSGAVGPGDGNGFKTGGSDDKALKHNATYTRCIAVGNVNDGFDHNSNRGSVTLLNCAAHNNGSNINFSSTNIAASLKIKNTASVGTLGGLNATSTDITNNSWQNGHAASSADYVSIDTSLLKAARKSDGSLPDVNYFKLLSGSDLRNAGVTVGLSYSGSAPDIGPFEFSE
jgi:hypothetical protein